MIHVKTLAPDDDPQVAQVNEEMKEMFGGMVPHVFTAMNLRVDLLQSLLKYVKQLMIEDPQGSDLVDEKAKALLRLAAKMTNESYKIIPEDIEALRRMGFSDEVILER